VLIGGLLTALSVLRLAADEPAQPAADEAKAQPTVKKARAMKANAGGAVQVEVKAEAKAEAKAVDQATADKTVEKKDKQAADQNPADARRAEERKRLVNLKLQRKLQARTDLKAEKLPLKDVVKKLAELHDIKIRLDEDALKKAGVASDTPITASIENFTLSLTLKHILKDHKLHFGIVDGEIVIGDQPPADAEPKPQAAVAVEVVEDGPVMQQVFVNGMMAQGGDAMVQQFQRQHKALLKAELILLQSVCHPTDEQLKQIHMAVEESLTGKIGKVKPEAAAGAERVVGARKVMRMAVNGQVAIGDPLKMTRDWVAKAVKAHLSEEQAAAYQNEVEQRNAARRESSVHAIVARFDRDLVLSDEQREQISTKIIENWNEAWSTSYMHILNSDQWYPNIPDQYVVEFLSPEQKTIWKQNRNQNRNVNFGVQQFAGFMNGMLGEEFLMQDEEQQAAPADAAASEGPQE
jgi:hypothetical protein